MSTSAKSGCATENSSIPGRGTFQKKQKRGGLKGPVALGAHSFSLLKDVKCSVGGCEHAS